MAGTDTPRADDNDPDFAEVEAIIVEACKPGMAAEGGPAFPQSHWPDSPWDADDNGNAMGMSLRDWFAGSAPETPDWFMSREQVELERDSPGFSGADFEWAAWVVRRDEFQMRRLIAWRWAYADAMLAHRRRR